MNPSPFTVSPNTHVSQVFNLFRTMGLRHLPVVNAVGEVSPSSTGGWGSRRPAQHRPRWSMHPPSGAPAAARESGLRSPRTRHSPSGGSLRRRPFCSCPTRSEGGWWAGGARRGFRNPSRRLLRFSCAVSCMASRCRQCHSGLCSCIPDKLRVGPLTCLFTFDPATPPGGKGVPHPFITLNVRISSNIQHSNYCRRLFLFFRD